MKDAIVQVGDPILRQKAKPVPKVQFGTPRIRAILARMKKALANEEFGVAIAAPQIGESLRIFVVAGRALLPENAPEDAPVPPEMVCINPELLRVSRKKREMSEGCLSVRGKYGTVLRHEKASIRCYDENGKEFTHHGSGLVAHIFQHETDHLDGILYIDKALKLEDEKSREKLREEFPA